jgi:hypothetical protein
VIDLRDEQDENAYDLMRVNSNSVSSDIDESELQYGKCPLGLMKLSGTQEGLRRAAAGGRANRAP